MLDATVREQRICIYLLDACPLFNGGRGPCQREPGADRDRTRIDGAIWNDP